MSDEEEKASSSAIPAKEEAPSSSILDSDTSKNQVAKVSAGSTGVQSQTESEVRDRILKTSRETTRRVIEPHLVKDEDLKRMKKDEDEIKGEGEEKEGGCKDELAAGDASLGEIGVVRSNGDLALRGRSLKRIPRRLPPGGDFKPELNDDILAIYPRNLWEQRHLRARSEPSRIGSPDSFVPYGYCWRCNELLSSASVSPSRRTRSPTSPDDEHLKSKSPSPDRMRMPIRGKESLSLERKSESPSRKWGSLGRNWASLGRKSPQIDSVKVAGEKGKKHGSKKADGNKLLDTLNSFGVRTWERRFLAGSLCSHHDLEMEKEKPTSTKVPLDSPKDNSVDDEFKKSTEHVEPAEGGTEAGNQGVSIESKVKDVEGKQVQVVEDKKDEAGEEADSSLPERTDEKLVEVEEVDPKTGKRRKVWKTITTTTEHYVIEESDDESKKLRRESGEEGKREEDRDAPSKTGEHDGKPEVDITRDEVDEAKSLIEKTGERLVEVEEVDPKTGKRRKVWKTITTTTEYYVIEDSDDEFKKPKNENQREGNQNKTQDYAKVNEKDGDPEDNSYGQREEQDITGYIKPVDEKIKPEKLGELETPHPDHTIDDSVVEEKIEEQTGRDEIHSSDEEVKDPSVVPDSTGDLQPPAPGVLDNDIEKVTPELDKSKLGETKKDEKKKLPFTWLFKPKVKDPTPVPVPREDPKESNSTSVPSLNPASHEQQPHEATQVDHDAKPVDDNRSEQEETTSPEVPLDSPKVNTVDEDFEKPIENVEPAEGGTEAGNQGVSIESKDKDDEGKQVQVVEDKKDEDADSSLPAASSEAAEVTDSPPDGADEKLVEVEEIDPKTGKRRKVWKTITTTTEHYVIEESDDESKKLRRESGEEGKREEDHDAPSKTGEQDGKPEVDITRDEVDESDEQKTPHSDQTIDGSVIDQTVDGSVVEEKTEEKTEEQTGRDEIHSSDEEVKDPSVVPDSTDDLQSSAPEPDLDKSKLPEIKKDEKKKLPFTWLFKPKVKDPAPVPVAREDPKESNSTSVPSLDPDAHEQQPHEATQVDHDAEPADDNHSEQEETASPEVPIDSPKDNSVDDEFKKSTEHVEPAESGTEAGNQAAPIESKDKDDEGKQVQVVEDRKDEDADSSLPAVSSDSAEVTDSPPDGADEKLVEVEEVDPKTGKRRKVWKTITTTTEHYVIEESDDESKEAKGGRKKRDVTEASSDLIDNGVQDDNSGDIKKDEEEPKRKEPVEKARDEKASLETPDEQKNSTDLNDKNEEKSEKAEDASQNINERESKKKSKSKWRHLFRPKNKEPSMVSGGEFSSEKVLPPTSSSAKGERDGKVEVSKVDVSGEAANEPVNASEDAAVERTDPTSSVKSPSTLEDGEKLDEPSADSNSTSHTTGKQFLASEIGSMKPSSATDDAHSKSDKVERDESALAADDPGSSAVSVSSHENKASDPFKSETPVESSKFESTGTEEKTLIDQSKLVTPVEQTKELANNSDMRLLPPINSEHSHLKEPGKDAAVQSPEWRSPDGEKNPEKGEEQEESTSTHSSQWSHREVNEEQAKEGKRTRCAVSSVVVTEIKIENHLYSAGEDESDQQSSGNSTTTEPLLLLQETQQVPGTHGGSHNQQEAFAAKEPLLPLLSTAPKKKDQQQQQWKLHQHNQYDREEVEVRKLEGEGKSTGGAPPAEKGKEAEEKELVGLEEVQEGAHEYVVDSIKLVEQQPEADREVEVEIEAPISTQEDVGETVNKKGTASEPGKLLVSADLKKPIDQQVAVSQPIKNNESEKKENSVALSEKSTPSIPSATIDTDKEIGWQLDDKPFIPLAEKVDKQRDSQVNGNQEKCELINTPFSAQSSSGLDPIPCNKCPIVCSLQQQQQQQMSEDTHSLREAKKIRSEQELPELIATPATSGIRNSLDSLTPSHLLSLGATENSNETANSSVPTDCKEVTTLNKSPSFTVQNHDKTFSGEGEDKPGEGIATMDSVQVASASSVESSDKKEPLQTQQQQQQGQQSSAEPATVTDSPSADTNSSTTNAADSKDANKWFKFRALSPSRAPLDGASTAGKTSGPPEQAGSTVERPSRSDKSETIKKDELAKVGSLESLKRPDSVADKAKTLPPATSQVSSSTEQKLSIPPAIGKLDASSSSEQVAASGEKSKTSPAASGKENKKEPQGGSKWFKFASKTLPRTPLASTSSLEGSADGKTQSTINLPESAEKATGVSSQPEKGIESEPILDTSKIDPSKVRKKQTRNVKKEGNAVVVTVTETYTLDSDEELVGESGAKVEKKPENNEKGTAAKTPWTLFSPKNPKSPSESTSEQKAPQKESSKEPIINKPVPVDAVVVVEDDLPGKGDSGEKSLAQDTTQPPSTSKWNIFSTLGKPKPQAAEIELGPESISDAIKKNKANSSDDSDDDDLRDGTDQQNKRRKKKPNWRERASKLLPAGIPLVGSTALAGAAVPLVAAAARDHQQEPNLNGSPSAGNSDSGKRGKQASGNGEGGGRKKRSVGSPSEIEGSHKELPMNGIGPFGGKGNNSTANSVVVPFENDEPERPYPKKVFFIVGNEFCERFSYYGLRTVLVLYFKHVLGYSDNLSTVSFHIFATLCYLTPILGAILGDSVWGKYKTILRLSIVYFIGELILLLSSIMWNAGSLSHAGTFLGLFLIGIGTGGIKPCVSALGGDQFFLSEEKRRKSFFSLFYAAINLGSMLSMLVTPLLRSEIHCVGRQDCYPLAFGVPAFLMLVAIIVFIWAKNQYHLAPLPDRNILLAFCEVVCTALRHKIKILCCCGSEQRDGYLRSNYLNADNLNSNSQLSLTSDLNSEQPQMTRDIKLPKQNSTAAEESNQAPGMATMPTGKAGRLAPGLGSQVDQLGSALRSNDESLIPITWAQPGKLQQQQQSVEAHPNGPGSEPYLQNRNELYRTGKIRRISDVEGFNRDSNNDRNDGKDHWLYLAGDKVEANLIEDFRVVLRILLLFLPIPVFWCLFDQQNSIWTLQAARMDGSILNTGITVKPDQMGVTNPILLLIAIPLFDIIIYPIFNRRNMLVGPISRMTLGGMFAAAAFVAAGLIELHIQSQNPGIAPPTKGVNLLLVNGLSNCFIHNATIGYVQQPTLDKQYLSSAEFNLPDPSESALFKKGPKVARYDDLALFSPQRSNNYDYSSTTTSPSPRITVNYDYLTTQPPASSSINYDYLTTMSPRAHDKEFVPTKSYGKDFDLSESYGQEIDSRKSRGKEVDLSKSFDKEFVPNKSYGKDSFDPSESYGKEVDLPKSYGKEFGSSKSYGENYERSTSTTPRYFEKPLFTTQSPASGLSLIGKRSKRDIRSQDETALSMAKSLPPLGNSTNPYSFFYKLSTVIRPLSAKTIEVASEKSEDPFKNYQMFFNLDDNEPGAKKSNESSCIYAPLSKFDLTLGHIPDESLKMIYLHEDNNKVTFRIFNESRALPDSDKARVRLLYEYRENLAVDERGEKGILTLRRKADLINSNTTKSDIMFKAEMHDGKLFISYYVDVDVPSDGDIFYLDCVDHPLAKECFKHNIRLDPGTRNLLILRETKEKGLEMKHLLLQDNNYRVSIFYQFIPYTLISISEVMFSITGLEFSYSMAPESMKSLIIGAWSLTTAFGNILTVAFESLHLFSNIAYDFLFYALLMFLDMLLFYWIGKGFR